MGIVPVIVAVALASTTSGFGKAYFQSRSELIAKVGVIAVVTLDEPEPAKPVGGGEPPAGQDGVRGGDWAYGQQATARVERVLKGKIGDGFVMYGRESFICARYELSKGRFLAFLRKDGELWGGSNWQLSLRPVQGKEVEWYVSEDQRFSRKAQALDEVIGQIGAVLAKARKEGPEKETPATGTPPP